MVPDPRLYALIALLSAERRQVEEVVGVEVKVEAALVRRVRVKDASAIAKEDAQARHLALRGPDLARPQERRRALVVVLDASLGFIQRNVEVVVEVAAKRSCLG
jgi:hypothetical protein